MIQAENDKTYIDSSLVYFKALKDAGVPAELHVYATGGHGFGMHPVGRPEEHWSETATAWLRSIGMLPETTTRHAASSGAGQSAPVPCAAQQPPIGRPQPAGTAGSVAAADNPACW
jgi:hypothetical protein